jgi:hypothetical protein
LLLSGCLSVCAFGQAQSSSGDIRGTVVDASGGVVVGAKVSVSDPARSIRRSTETGADGAYSLALLPPGTYRLRVEAPGFATHVTEGIEVRVGDSVLLRTEMAVGALATEVTIVAETPVVEPDRTQQSNTIESVRIANLPINRRNYLDFALLAPGVVETNDLVDGTDYRVVQTPQSGLSFGGSNGRGNAFTIDGISNYYNSGGVRPSISQEAVQEFQINRNSFSAEFGGAVGGAINIVSRSGANEFHGGLFGFLRQRNLQARNYFDPVKSAFTRVQAGAVASGPVVRDRTFFFAALERLDRHETAFVPILQDRSAFNRMTPSQQQLVDFLDASGSPQLAGLSRAMKAALIPGNHAGTAALFNSNSGNFPFSENSTQVSGRLDHRLSARHDLFFRANLTKGLSENAQFGALIAFNRGRSLDVLDSTLMASDTFVVSPTWVIQSRLGVSYNNLDVVPTDPFGPGLDITGFGLFGREIFLPSSTWERHLQFQQVWTHHRSAHDLKFGVDVNPVRDTVRSETFFAGRFSFGNRVPLGLVLNSAAGDPNFSTRLAATLAAAGRQSLVPALQAPLTALQSFSVGLPEFYQQGFGDPHWVGWSKRYNLFVQDGWRVLPQLTLNFGARYELEVNEEIVGTDGNNIAPRFGFAWTPARDGKTVVRGGYGLYYSQINLQIPNVADTLAGAQIAQTFVPLTGIPGLNNPRTGRTLTAADIYQTLAAQGVIGRRAITREDLAQFGLRPSVNAPLSVVFGIVDDFVNPWAHQASFEIERAVGAWAVSAAYNFNRAAHLVRILDRNLFYTGRRADGAPTFGFYNPLLSQRNIFESTANSFYHSLILGAAKRFSRGVSLNAHYTFSKAIDEVTDFNTDFQPNDQLNARADRALSGFHQAHRFVANAVLAPEALGGFTLSPILVAGSGRPFNVLTGFDNLGDRHSTTHRPVHAGRNIGRGPDYFTIDARLSRKFGGEKRNIEFVAEGFNLLNRTNFKSLNNTVGDVRLSDLPRPLVGLRGPTTEPLSFTSAFDPRQFQLGVRVNW